MCPSEPDQAALAWSRRRRAPGGHPGRGRPAGPEAGRAWTGWLRVALLVVCVLGTGAGSGAGQIVVESPASRPALSPEEQLWQRIRELRDPRVTTRSAADLPSAGRFQARLQQRQTLANYVQLYLRLYPGGAHRDEAVAEELATLHELGALSGGQSTALCERVGQYLRDPPSRAALAEAAWWDILCRRMAAVDAASQPARHPPGTWPQALDEPLRIALTDYLERFPDGRRAPQAAWTLFDAAERRDDRLAMRRIVELMSRHWPEHGVTESLVLRLRRREAVGKPVDFALQIGATTWSAAALRGRAVALVVWTSRDPDVARQLERVEAWRRTHAEAQVIGVNLDPAREPMEELVRSLGLEWPQFHDPLGPAGAFAGTWGIRRTPVLLAIDRRGILVDLCTDSGDWSAALERCLDPGPGDPAPATPGAGP